MDIYRIVDEYAQFGQWAETLNRISDEEWLRPTQPGKASIAEIVSHLRNWDLHLIQAVIPAIERGAGMTFPDFDSYNREAYEYANSGVPKKRLLQQLANDRLRLISLLKTMEPEILTRATTAGGVTHCPNTGQPYSLLYIIQEFIEHDEHHKEQILRSLHTA